MENNQFWAFLLMAFLVGGLVGYGMGGLQNVVSGKPSFVQQDGTLGNCISDCVVAGNGNPEQCVDGCKNGELELLGCGFSKNCADIKIGDSHAGACASCQESQGTQCCKTFGCGSAISDCGPEKGKRVFLPY